MLRKIVTSLPQFSTEHQEVCRGCALGKYTKASFPSSEHIAAKILELVHSDVCGQGEVFNRFHEFKALVENQTGKKMKVLRSDNGDEYTSNEF